MAGDTTPDDVDTAQINLDKRKNILKTGANAKIQGEKHTRIYSGDLNI